MTVLVTGPTGIVGANLVRLLVRKGAKVRHQSLPRYPSVSTVKRTYTDVFVTPEKATIELGLPLSSMKATALRTVQWFQEHERLWGGESRLPPDTSSSL